MHQNPAAQAFGSQVFGSIPKPPTVPTFHGEANYAEGIGGKSFGETLASMVSKANDIMAEPENLTIDAVTTGNTDIHEVMIAMGKSEVAFKMITAVTQKTIGGFDKLTSMQI